ncbi:MAG TPA: AAA family ATPase [Trebonia sp.]|jgi:DNA-binding CsgD family transcriptional regulator|nr:AAA family ATPase [Trebonia sp.]
MRGREAQQRAIGELLRCAQEGGGGVVLVEGEPGIGKSALLRDSLDQAAERGIALVADAADKIGEAVPFYALRQALGESFAKLVLEAADYDLPAAPAWWISRIRAHLERQSAATPVLVCLDDLQWASAATLAAVRVLPRELGHRPVAWLLARSTSQREETEHLFAVLESDGAARVQLSPLDEDDVTSLLTDAFGAPPDTALCTLAAEAAGNPWLLSELIAGLRDEDAVRVTDGTAALVCDRVPRRLHAAARQRLDDVSENARSLLTTAAVLGSSFRLEDLAEMLDRTPAVLLPAVEETMAVGLTAATDIAFSFRHQLLRRALHDMMPPPGRKALHRQYGRILLGRGESAVLAAGHLMQAADPASPSSLAELDAAADRTLRSAPQSAADLADRALRLTLPGDPAAVPRAVAAAEALTAAGRLDEADSVAREVLAKPLPATAEARLRCVLATVLCARGAAGDADREARAALARPGLPPAVRDDATAVRLQALASLHDRAVVPLAETVLADPDRHARHVVAAAMTALAAVNWDEGRAGEALRLLRDAARLETAVSPDARHAQPLLALAAALTALRQHGEAEAILDAAAGRALRAIPARAAALIVRARIHLAAGRLSAAAEEAGRALDVAGRLGAHGYATAARAALGAVALRGGDVFAAAGHIAEGMVPGPHGGDAYLPAEVVIAQVAEAHEGLDSALPGIRQLARELRDRPGVLLGDPATAAWLTRAALAGGDCDLAREVAVAAGALAAGDPGYPAVTAAAAHSRGLAGRDPALLAEAVATYPDPWSRGSAAEDLGLLAAAGKDNELAVRYLAEAAGSYKEAGATADVARARRRLRKLGVRHRDWTRQARRPDSGWASLTDAERTAAELVAQGLNNRQVGNLMYVSMHTVAFYLRQAFRKLGISSRVELARIVIERSAADERQPAES